MLVRVFVWANTYNTYTYCHIHDTYQIHAKKRIHSTYIHDTYRYMHICTYAFVKTDMHVWRIRAHTCAYIQIHTDMH